MIFLVPINTFFFLVALRSELTRRAQSASAQVYERMTQSEKMLQEQIDDQKAISAGGISFCFFCFV